MPLLTLRQARRRANLTQAQLAERAGVARTTVQKHEAGVADPHPPTIEALAKALGTTPAQLRLERPTKPIGNQPPDGPPARSAWVTHLADGTVVVDLDEYMNPAVQKVLFGSERAWLTKPEPVLPDGGAISPRPPSANWIRLQLRELPVIVADLLVDANKNADNTDDPPYIVEAERGHGLTLRTSGIDYVHDREYVSEGFIPWHLLISVATGSSAELRLHLLPSSSSYSEVPF
jgi:transcriptional regulator with XRE-family HTH domain